MSYVRWNPGNLYMWYDTSSGTIPQAQILALWYAPDVAKEDTVLYFSYDRLKHDLVGCIIDCKKVGVKNKEVPKLRQCIRKFILDVEKKGNYYEQ